MNTPENLNSQSNSAPAKYSDLGGKLIGDFKVLYKLGHGGMGQVFLAEQVSLKRKVALKILRADLAEDSDSLQRFKKEAEAIAQVVHPCIVQVYAIGEAEGQHFMALEYVEGRNLKEYLTLRGTLDIHSLVSVLRQVASALQRASELGIIHRDIKPENILLTRKGEVKVADFGLARFAASAQPLNLTQAGMTLGTPLYMAPEQVEGKQIDQRTDIYSLGVTAYHMIAGHPPYQGDTAVEVAFKHLRGEVELLETIRPDFSKDICELVRKMMSVDPMNRPQSFAEVLNSLVQISKKEKIDLELLASFPSITAIQNSDIQMFQNGTTGIYKAPVNPWGMISKTRLLLIGVILGTVILGVITGRYYKSNQTSHLVMISNLHETDEDILDNSYSEQSLKLTVDRYLNSNSKSKNTAGGSGVCTDLGLLYLGSHKLKEAEKLYQSCKLNSRYEGLGNLGLGIVYALKSEAEKSQEYLDKVSPSFAINICNTYPEMKFWLKEAFHFNAQNGVKDGRNVSRLLKDAGPKINKKNPDLPNNKGLPLPK
jgi:eukaryotic-like serine/threonine-protein kinase